MYKKKDDIIYTQYKSLTFFNQLSTCFPLFNISTVIILGMSCYIYRELWYNLSGLRYNYRELCYNFSELCYFCRE